jgi:hypothetical protein
MLVETPGDAVSLIGFILGIIYGVGLIIVTIHLSRYGITNIYLIRTKYLVVGFTYFLHMLGMGILSALVVLVSTLLLGLNTVVYVLVPISALGYIALFWFGFFPDSLEHIVQRLSKRRSSSSPTHVKWGIWRSAIFCSFFLFWYCLIQSFIIGDTALRAMSITLLVAVSLIGIVYYTLFLYLAPISVGIPALELIGSGRPIQVRLTVDKEAISGLKKHGLFASHDETSEPVSLLDETEKYLIVLVELDGEKKALRVSKSIVHSVIYLP